jgi:pimeloyl-ACP methyl ester carboxylesterase
MDGPAGGFAPSTRLPGESPANCVARIAGMAEFRRVSFGDGEMVWRIWGAGRPVVFLHGGYGAWSHWILNVLSLSPHIQAIVGDLPGHGDSDPMVGRPTRERMADTLARCLDGVLPKNGPYDIVGFSMGANLSAAAAAAYGRSPENLVVVGAGGLGVSSEKIHGLQKWRPDLPRDELDARHRNNLGIIMMHDAARIDDLAVHAQRENGLRNRYHVARADASTLLRDYLGRLDTKLSSIWGEHDVYAIGNRDRRIAVMRETHPDMRVSVIEDAGHWVMYEQPERFNAELLRLLSQDAQGLTGQAGE